MNPARSQFLAEPEIVVVPYDDGWPDDFANLGSSLRDSLGDRAIRIDHIGSTSVPGLAAKDRIDIQLTVDDLDAEVLRPVMESAGFEWIAHITTDHSPAGLDLDPDDLGKFLTRSGPTIRAANCHIRQRGRYNQRYPLLNRDYLRAVPEAARTYEQIKLTLAGWFPDDAESYYDIKDPVFDLIMLGAERWAATTRWQPGPSDA